MSIEVEIKARANLLKVSRRLEVLGKRPTSDTVKVDTYYGSTLESLRDKKIRVREAGGRIAVTAKRKSIADGVETSEEMEFFAEPATEVDKLLRFLGFAPTITKRKYTVAYPWTTGVTVELNEVDHLGGFVEVEALLSDQAEPRFVEKTREDLRLVLKLLEIDESEIESRPYTELLRQEMPLEFPER